MRFIWQWLSSLKEKNSVPSKLVGTVYSSSLIVRNWISHQVTLIIPSSLAPLNHCSKHKYETSCYKAVSFKFGMSISPYAQSYLKISFMFLHWDNFITIAFRNFSDNHLTFIWHENICILSPHLCFCTGRPRFCKYLIFFFANFNSTEWFWP